MAHGIDDEFCWRFRILNVQEMISKHRILCSPCYHYLFVTKNVFAFCLDTKQTYQGELGVSNAFHQTLNLIYKK